MADVAAVDIAAVLARHSGWDGLGRGVIECEGCGWRSESLGPEWNGRKDDRHIAHVASEVTAWLTSKLAAAETAEAVVDQLHMLSAIPREPTHEETAAAALGAVAGVLTGGVG